MTGIVELSGPEEIEARSFAIIEEETGRSRPFDGAEWLVVRRMIHTSADFQLLDLVRFHPEAVQAGIEALRNGCLVATDTEMARAGISQARLERLGCRKACYIRESGVAERARREGITRSSAAVDHAAPQLDGAVYVVGNAPTALLRLLRLIGEGACAPALIVGMPVGFVNAAESKELLAGQDRIPYVTIQGRKGGSPLAAAVVNQLALLALKSEIGA
ncbi:MAG: precorrin-8X methylmutase [Deltaproteobacteria bacterium]|nr:precorrin-8X methylmutase [Deltaproteobacteria bacterium]